MIALALFIAVVVALVAWVFVLRPLVRHRPRWQPFFNAVDPIEQWLWSRSRGVLLGRLASVPATLLVVHDTVMSWAMDWTPVLGRMFAAVPDDLRPLAITGAVGAYGWLVEWVRRQTVEPVSAKE